MLGHLSYLREDAWEVPPEGELLTSGVVFNVYRDSDGEERVEARVMPEPYKGAPYVPPAPPAIYNVYLDRFPEEDRELIKPGTVIYIASGEDGDIYRVARLKERAETV